MSIRIRLADVSDHGDLLVMDEECFPADQRISPSLPGQVWWIAADGTKPVAYAGATFWCAQNEKALYLHRAGVLDAYRGRGLQRRLIGTRLRYAKTCGLPEVWSYTAIGNVWSSNNLIAKGFDLWSPKSWAGVERPLEAATGSRFLYWRKMVG